MASLYIKIIIVCRFHDMVSVNKIRRFKRLITEHLIKKIPDI